MKKPYSKHPMGVEVSVLASAAPNLEKVIIAISDFRTKWTFFFNKLPCMT